MTTITRATVLSSAPPAAFFRRWADCATWPEWNTDTAWCRLDGPFKQGATGSLKPAGGPRVRFVVEELGDDRFVDVSRVPGGRITFDHRVRETVGGTEVSVTVSIDGLLGAFWRRVLGGGFRATTATDLERLAAVAEADTAAAATQGSASPA